jgi:CBS domain-containing protein
MKIEDIMTRNPITVKKTDSLTTLLRILARKKITGCPVVDARNNIVGVVGHTDVLKFIDVHSKINAGGFSPFVSALIKKGSIDTKKLKNACVKDFFTEGAVTVGHDEDVYKAARIMSKNSINRLPVVKNRKLVGIVTKTDIIRVLQKA